VVGLEVRGLLLPLFVEPAKVIHIY
jgi:hypothetical protein